MRVIHTSKAPPHTSPVPQAVETAGWIFVSAVFGSDPETGDIPSEARAEAELLFNNLRAILDAADADLTDLVRVGVFMKQLQRDRPEFNEVWKEQFGDHRPARSAVQAGDFGPPQGEVRYMLEAVAHRS